VELADLVRWGFGLAFGQVCGSDVELSFDAGLWRNEARGVEVLCTPSRSRIPFDAAQDRRV
jgi:hypothetical protein